VKKLESTLEPAGFSHAEFQSCNEAVPVCDFNECCICNGELTL